MLRAEIVLAAGTWVAEPTDSVVLEFDERHRRRVMMKAVRGLEFLLDLAGGGDAAFGRRAEAR